MRSEANETAFAAACRGWTGYLDSLPPERLEARLVANIALILACSPEPRHLLGDPYYLHQADDVDGLCRRLGELEELYAEAKTVDAALANAAAAGSDSRRWMAATGLVSALVAEEVAPFGIGPQFAEELDGYSIVHQAAVENRHIAKRLMADLDC